MDEKPTKRDTLATLEVVVRMISLLLIPVLIWILGAWYNNQQKQIEDRRIAAENSANRLTSLLKNLSSDNSRERKLAVVISKYLAGQDQLPPELVQVLAVIAESDTNKEVANAAFLSLDAIANAGKEQGQVAREVLNEVPGRIYIQVVNKNQVNIARQIGVILKGEGYQVPATEIVPGALSNDQLRFFHEGDRAEAEKIAGFLREKSHRISTSFIRGYENKVRNRQFEIWIAGN